MRSVVNCGTRSFWGDSVQRCDPSPASLSLPQRPPMRPAPPGRTCSGAVDHSLLSRNVLIEATVWGGNAGSCSMTTHAPCSRTREGVHIKAFTSTVCCSAG